MYNQEYSKLSDSLTAHFQFNCARLAADIACRRIRLGNLLACNDECSEVKNLSPFENIIPKFAHGH
jgi:hypothetical protein